MSGHACVNCFSALTNGPVCPKCGFDNAAYAPEPHFLRPGTTLHQRYIIGRALGQGGFGITYSGFDLNFNIRVAVKEYFPKSTVWRQSSQTSVVSCYPSENDQKNYKDGIQKCLLEAQALAKFDDIPGIVRVWNFFRENNTAYVIMEFVEGVTLVAYLKRLPQRPGYREALSLLSPVGEALAQVHDRGFVHRDVSPDNIMITGKGTPKLLDFGAVKLVTEGGSSTETPIVKPGFSPMEMYYTTTKIGPRSDIYSFCATLFYMVTGNVMELPTDRDEEDQNALRLSRAASPGQTAALMKGLAYFPKNRYQTIPEMMAALAACRDDPPPGPEETEDVAGETDGATVPETELEENVPETELEDKVPETDIEVSVPETEIEVSVPETEIEEAVPETVIEEREEETKDEEETSDEEDGAEGKEPPRPPFPRKYLVAILAGVAVLLLCIVIGVFAGKSSDKVSIITTTKASSATKEENDKSDNVTITPLNSANVGNYVSFGAYEQDNDTSNGKEAIEWKVLAKEDGKALLISLCGLDCQRYNDEYSDVTWETCMLRTWLNGTFMESAFSTDEQSQIVNSIVTADKNPDYNTSPGNDTNDHIFLLSIQEAEKYFGSDNERKCQPTTYAKAQGVWMNDSGCCWWWLRSPGDDSLSAANVLGGGYVSRAARYVDGSGGAVRPALWIDLSSSTAEPQDAEPSSASEPQSTEPDGKPVDQFTSVNVGDYVTFGAYEQDNDTSNGKEDIEWKVLAKEDGKALLISRYGLDRKEYGAHGTWETCTLRNWLNVTFLNDAFSSDEQRQIADSMVTADKNPEYDTDPGNDTTDKIFLLSIPEAEIYFSSDDERKCQPTDYAKEQGEYVNLSTDYQWWWLRSRGSYFSASYVRADGSIFSQGTGGFNEGVVRPVLWIELSGAALI